MTTTGSASGVSRYDRLRELAVANIERLFEFWKIDYRWVNSDELDFISPVRSDSSFGACRFNIKKGVGADFANLGYSDTDFKSIGLGFDTSDFELSKDGTRRQGFDIIGLAQLIYSSPSYREAAIELSNTLTTMHGQERLAIITEEAILKRKQDLQLQRDKKVELAAKIVSICKPLIGTPGEKYLVARGIKLKSDLGIKFHPQVKNAEINKYCPCLIFPIQSQPGGPLEGIHRIYLSEDCTKKASVKDPKMALGSVKGNAIWFGTGTHLYISEGPENALSLVVSGATFVACSINASNVGGLSIPPYVKEITIAADNDKPGLKAAQAALEKYKKNFRTSILLPALKVLPNGRNADFNDILRGV